MAHIHEMIDFSATAFVVFNKKVLLRFHDKYAMWLGVGGHVELDEDVNAALLREVKEEVGLDVDFMPPRDWHPAPVSLPGFRELVPPNAMNIHKINETHQHNDLIFYVRASTDRISPERPDDIWRWLTEDELLSLPQGEVIEEVVHYACEALRLASYEEN